MADDFIIDLDSFSPNQTPITRPPQPAPRVVEVDWDGVLVEWSYRLPKGYPTFENGEIANKLELEILQEILKEYGIDEMPSLKVKQSRQPIPEAEARFSKEDLIKLINSTELSEEDLVRVMRIVDATGSESGIV
jgi:hypothetical protein